MRFTKAKTGREAIVQAVLAFNRRMRLAVLTQYAGTCKNLMPPQELHARRRQG